MSKKSILLLGIILVVGLLASTVTFQVDQFNDMAVVKTVGVVSGKPLMGEEGAGLKFKAPYPIQTVTMYPAKDFITEDPNEQVATKDGKYILISTFCNWRIEDPVKLDAQVNGSGSTEKAEQQIRTWLQITKGNVVAKYSMDQIINTDPGKMQLGKIEQEILDGREGETPKDKVVGLKQRATDTYGILVTNVGVKVLGLTGPVSKAVIDSQILERQKAAKDYTSMGNAQSMAIINRAKAASDEIIAFAQRRAEYIRTEGQRDAATYYKTFKENERLAMYLRMLESLRRELSGRSMLILDSSWNPAMGYFQNRPSLDSVKLPDEIKKATQNTPPASTNGQGK
jgi:membrane protease subunit HflC